MRFSTSFTYPAPLRRVTGMVADAEFYRIRYTTQLKAARILDLRVSSHGDQINHCAVCEIRPASLDRRASTLVPGTVTMRLTQTWELTQGLAAAGRLRIEADAQPVRTQIALALHPGTDPDTTVCEAEGEVSAAVRFVGAIIERELLCHLDRFVHAEEATARLYLESHPDL